MMFENTACSPSNMKNTHLNWWKAALICNSSVYLEKAMAPHSSTLAWKIPWTEEAGGLQSMGSLRVGHDWATSLSRIGERNGNPLQCSCLENPRDGGAWWLPSTRSDRVGHDWSDLAIAAATNKSQKFPFQGSSRVIWVSYWKPSGAHGEPCWCLGTIHVSCMHALCSVMSDSFATPWTITRQTPLSMEFLYPSILWSSS